VNPDERERRLRAIVEGVHEPAEGEPAAAAATSWAPVDLEALEVGEAERPTLLARTDEAGLFYPGRKHAVFGEPESGKSWFVQLACAERLLEGERVVYVDFEDTAPALVRRLEVLGVDRDRIVDGLVYIAPAEPLGDRARGEVQAALAEACAFAVVDGVTEAMVADGLDPDKNADVARWMGGLPAILAASGAAVVTVDYVTKDTRTRGRYAIGGQHKLAAIDGAAFALAVIRPLAPGQTGVVRVTVAKDRIGGVRAVAFGGRVAGELVVVSDPDGGDVLAQVRPVDANVPEGADDLRPSQRWVLEVLPGEPPGLTVREVGDHTAADGHPLKRPTIDKALRDLERAGLADGIHAASGLAGTWFRPAADEAETALP
jgi:AAA domain